MPTATELPAPAVYRPYHSGVFSFGPGLKRLGHDFGNGPRDAQTFQIDRAFETYRASTTAALTRHAEAYAGVCGLAPARLDAANRWIAARLCAEHPALFRLESGVLCCELTGQRVVLAQDPTEAFFGLAAQIQEDLALVALDESSEHLAAVHVTTPNYWSPRAKLGQSFAGVHAPVPSMEQTKRQALPMLQRIGAGNAYSRFVWGIETDDDLDHHPERVGDTHDRSRAWHAAPPEARRLWLRYERQTVQGVPDANLVLFTIRTYLRDVSELPHEDRVLMARALRALEGAERAYKGLDQLGEQMLAQLDPTSNAAAHE